MKNNTYVPDTEIISAKKRIDTILEFLNDPYKLNVVMSSYSYYDDHLRRLAKRIKNENNYKIRSFIEDLLQKPETAVEFYENSESLPIWFRKVLYDFVICNAGRIRMKNHL